MADPLGEALRFTPEFRGKGRLVMWWQRRQASRSRSRFTRWGYRLILDKSEPYEAMIWLDREERCELDQLGRLLRHGDCFIDVGANIGLWSLRAGLLVGPTGRVWAVEPNPVVYKRLDEHVRLNDLKGVVVPVECAAGAFESCGVLKASNTHNVASVRLAGMGDKDAIIAVRRLDEIVGMSSQPHGIKIDVEGSELAVLEGARDLLGKWRPWVCVEFNTTLLPSNRLGDWPVHRLLSEFGYRTHPTLFGDPEQKTVDPSWSPSGYHNLLYLHPFAIDGERSCKK